MSSKGHLLQFEMTGPCALVINLRTAKGLGMTMPHSLLLLADEMMQ